MKRGAKQIVAVPTAGSFYLLALTEEGKIFLAQVKPEELGEGDLFWQELEVPYEDEE